MNPERPDEPHATNQGTASPGMTISNGLVENLQRTRPWVLFMGVMVLLGCALMLLFAVIMLVAGALAPSDELGGPLGAMTLGIVYVLMALLYLVPAVHLMRYGAAIKRIGTSDTAAEIEQALKHQLAFWRFVGIVTIAVIALYIVIFLGAILVAGVAATGG